jgi:DNA-binding transcriptional LysR family regulator
MTLDDLKAFAAVAAERSFSRAARTLHRTQPAVSQAIRRLEDACGERLIERSSRDGSLTEAGILLLDYAQRTMRLVEEAAAAVADLRDVKKGRVIVGANEAGVHTLLPLIASFHAVHPSVLVDVRRIHSRQMAQEVLLRTVDCGVLSFAPPDKDLLAVPLGTDELVLLVPPGHALAKKKQITMEEMGRQAVIAHNDPSPLRDRVLRMYEKRHAPLNISMSLPSLDGIKRAVESGMGVALLPRRSALSELKRGHLIAVKVPELRSPRQLRLVYRRDGEYSHASQAFLEVVRKYGSRASTRSTSA